MQDFHTRMYMDMDVCDRHTQTCNILDECT